MKSQPQLPVYHELKFCPGSYERVYWPAPTQKSGRICIKKDSRYIRPNGTIIQLTALFEGTLYPMANYKIGDQDKIYSTPLYWFAENIALSLA